MPGTETLEDFYRGKLNWLPDNIRNDIGHFNVFRMEDCLDNTEGQVVYSRRDFYKIALIRGKYLYHYADKSVTVSGNTLVFFNPSVPYKFEQLDDSPKGFFCIFREAFFTEHLRANIKELPMFMPGGKPSYELNLEQDKFVSDVFEKMLAEIGSDYQFKYDLLRNYVTEIIHYALKIKPTEILYQHTDANTRITTVFTELLERQFPIESPAQRFSLRSAKDFADQLAVHVNHLNRAIKLTTGKTTTIHITERLTIEALALLKHTNWNISEISYCLGFEEPTHFNHFFRKQTNRTPSAFRSNAS